MRFKLIDDGDVASADGRRFPPHPDISNDADAARRRLECVHGDSPRHG